jgi:thiamine biosynthesis lipoprotein
MELWGFYRKRKKLPSKPEIESTLARVGFDKVILDDSDMSVRFTVPGMSIDLGGVAKGYAVDLAADAAKAAGIRSGLINLAGNMYCFPVAPEGRECFTVGVRNPLRKDRVCGTIQLLNTSVATSGNYERFVNIAGHNYAHIMNPVTGRPVSGRLSVTVVTPLAVYADILSTSIYIKGEKFARRVRAEMPATSALIIECAPEDSSEYRIIPLGNTWGDINHSL